MALLSDIAGELMHGAEQAVHGGGNLRQFVLAALFQAAGQVVFLLDAQHAVEQPPRVAGDRAQHQPAEDQGKQDAADDDCRGEGEGQLVHAFRLGALGLRRAFDGLHQVGAALLDRTVVAVGGLRGEGVQGVGIGLLQGVLDRPQVMLEEIADRVHEGVDLGRRARLAGGPQQFEIALRVLVVLRQDAPFLAQFVRARVQPCLGDVQP